MHRSENKAPLAILVPIASAAAVPFYFLSAGPFGWLVVHDYVPQAWFAWWYYPLFALARLWLPFSNLLVWYLSFFGPV